MNDGKEGSPQHHQISKWSAGDVALFKDIADAAAEKAVEKTFTAMGLDPNDPIAAQRDFVVLRELAQNANDPERRADDEWTHRTRVRMEGAFGKAVITAVGLAVLSAGHAIVAGAKAIISMPLPK